MTIYESLQRHHVDGRELGCPDMAQLWLRISWFAFLAMSASKLEKALANMERRMREEFRAELGVAMRSCLQRLQSLEDMIEAGARADVQRNSLQVKKLMGDIITPQPDEDDEPKSSPELSCSIQVVDAPKIADTRLEDAMEPVAFLETTWNLVLVLGHAGVGWVDALISCLLLFLSAGMQIAFSLIILQPEFQGEPFDETQVHTARTWRQSVAHDHTYMDLAQTSLTSRVCNNDGSLIISTDQAALLNQINKFLGLDTSELEATGFRPGILMAMLCMLLWCLYVCNEFRTIFISLEAVYQIPRSSKTSLHNGKFQGMSGTRFFTYCALRILRACIAAALLYAGILWLGSTTSITDLILNAVALGAILEVDELIFSALMPKKVQLRLQDLEAIKVSYSQTRSQIEAFCLCVVLAGLLAWPWFTLVEPLGKTMEAVKQAHCGGPQDFVVGLNEDQHMTVGFKSVPFDILPNQTITQLAVSDFISDFISDDTAAYITFHGDIRRFEKYRTQTMKEAAEENTWCADLDSFFVSTGAQAFSDTATYYEPHFRSVQLTLGFAANSTCSDMQKHCDDPDAQLLRFVCGRTCCTDPLRNPWFKVAARGCPVACLQEAGKQGECKDQSISPAWTDFWDYYPKVIEAETANAVDFSQNSSVTALVTLLIESMKAQGCVALALPSFSQDRAFVTLSCTLYTVYLIHICII